MTAFVLPKDVLRPRPDVRIRRIAGTVTIGLGGEAFELAESTYFLWRRIDGKRSVRELSELLAAHYEIAAGTALEDTVEVLTELRDRGLFAAATAEAPGRTTDDRPVRHPAAGPVEVAALLRDEY